MKTTLLQMTLLMLCGAVWRIVSPNKLTAEQTRHVLTSVVYYFLLPAMVLQVLWCADIGWSSLQFSFLGCASILLCIGLSWVCARLLRISPAKSGALILAAAYPNVTYLGLPVLEQTLGAWSRSVVIQLDLFAAAPLVFTVGIMLARHFGEAEAEHKPKFFLAFLNAPPFWAAFLAVLLNINHIPIPDWLDGLLEKCAAAVAPLMIFSLGLALSWRSLRWRNLPYMLPVVVIKLAFMPWAAMTMLMFMGMTEQNKAAAVLDLAMPSMVLGIVLCDRYKLDSSLYASAVMVTTGLSLLTLPFWHQMIL
ncbi:AEC family transporter [Methylomonas sp. AM2-LC]|uniref:AEC family transporter n=1 Tax=Methylomonas sp. AM2-LC TaxID=3153301 RepID=UPI003263710A